MLQNINIIAWHYDFCNVQITFMFTTGLWLRPLLGNHMAKINRTYL